MLRRAGSAASGVPSRCLVSMLPPRALPHRFKGSAEGGVARYLSPLAREPPCWVHARVYGVEMEVERKFLVSRPPDLGGRRPTRLSRATWRSAPMGRSGSAARAISSSSPPSAAQASRAGGRDRARPTQLRRALGTDQGRRLHKRRHVIPLGDLKIEVDVYEGELEGLVVAEIEFPPRRRRRRSSRPAGSVRRSPAIIAT